MSQDDPSHRALAISRRPVHVRYRGDVTAAAAWKAYALKQRKALLWAGDAAMTRVFHPAPGVEVRVSTTGVVDFITIRAGLADVGLVLEGRTNPDNPTVHQVVLEDKPPAKTAKFRHPFSKKPLLGGNIDWTDTTGKVCLTWKGPLGRSIGPLIVSQHDPRFNHLEAGSVDFFLNVDVGLPMFDIEGQQYEQHLYRRLDGGIDEEICVNTHALYTRWDTDIWRQGRVIGTAMEDHYVIGACQSVYRKNGVVRKYLVAVMVANPPPARYSDPKFVQYDNGQEQTVQFLDFVQHLGPEHVAHKIVWAPWPSGSKPVKPGDWNLAAVVDFGEQTAAMLPPNTAYVFSGKGLLFAAMVPKGVSNALKRESLIEGDNSLKYIGGQDYTYSAVSGEEAIVRGQLIPMEDEVKAEYSITHQADATGRDSGSGEKNYRYYYGYGVTVEKSTRNESTINRQGESVVAIDFVGEEEVTLSLDYAYRYASLSATSNTFDDGLGDAGNKIAEEGSSSSTTEIEWTLTDDYRQLVIGHMLHHDVANSSYSSSWDIDNLNLPPSTTASSTRTIDMSEKRPLYYDLRRGLGVYAETTMNDAEYQIVITDHLANELYRYAQDH